MAEEKGYVYILTNPSFPEYVKIGYADNVEERVKVLNSRECTPFAFRIYATLEVPGRLKDVSIHNLFNKLNPTLRSKDEIDGKIRVREFYAMSPEDAFELFELIADIWNNKDKLKIWTKTKEEKADEKTAEKISKLALNRHHIKEIDFTCSLTGHSYHGKTASSGGLCLIDTTIGKEVGKNAKPSMRQIVGQAIIDLGGIVDKKATLYQRYRTLTKLVLEK